MRRVFFAGCRFDVSFLDRAAGSRTNPNERDFRRLHDEHGQLHVSAELFELACSGCEFYRVGNGSAALVGSEDRSSAHGPFLRRVNVSSRDYEFCNPGWIAKWAGH
jgi:hypothetical protein